MTGAVVAGRELIDSRFAAWRLVVALALMTIGGAGMYVVPVVLPVVQAEFGVARGDASLPYTLLMIGFGVGGVIMGRLADRFGIMLPLLVGAVSLSLGFAAAAFSTGILGFMLVHGLLIGLLGSSATFAPLIADASLWFEKRRGIAVAVCASGNYLAGTVWPPIVQALIEAIGWRQTYLALAGFALVSISALALTMRVRPPPAQSVVQVGSALASDRPFGLKPGQAQALLCVAGIACCVAMSMPQVHIVAYCGDLGFGAARGAQMLSLMLGFGVVSRLISGAICDRIGGLRTLLLGSALQCVALLLFLPFDELWSLFLVSALFGLFQGGIVPAYAIIVREYFAPADAGARVGTVIMFTLLGMALGGWMSGVVFDLTGSYRAAFLNGVGWNLLNMTIVIILLWRVGRIKARHTSAAGKPLGV
ncbi:MAG: MFS transporter [Burkholderiales bacterium]